MNYAEEFFVSQGGGMSHSHSNGYASTSLRSLLSVLPTKQAWGKKAMAIDDNTVRRKFGK